MNPDQDRDHFQHHLHVSNMTGAMLGASFFVLSLIALGGYGFMHKQAKAHPEELREKFYRACIHETATEAIDSQLDAGDDVLFVLFPDGDESLEACLRNKEKQEMNNIKIGAAGMVLGAACSLIMLLSSISHSRELNGREKTTKPAASCPGNTP